MFNERVATNVTISIGIAIFENEDAEGALEKADKPNYCSYRWQDFCPGERMLCLNRL